MTFEKYYEFIFNHSLKEIESGVMTPALPPPTWEIFVEEARKFFNAGYSHRAQIQKVNDNKILAESNRLKEEYGELRGNFASKIFENAIAWYREQQREQVNMSDKIKPTEAQREKARKILNTHLVVPDKTLTDFIEDVAQALAEASLNGLKQEKNKL